MRYKAVVFDFDLTLADSSKAIIECYKHTLTKFGYPVPRTASYSGLSARPLRILSTYSPVSQTTRSSRSSAQSM